MEQLLKKAMTKNRATETKRLPSFHLHIYCTSLVLGVYAHGVHQDMTTS